jgi:hypothetical protein
MKLEEYTLRVTHRPDWDSWEAELLEFFALKAGGQTRDEALIELERLFDERVAYLRAAGKPLPVPGEQPEEMFSTSSRIDAQAGMARDFFKRVLSLDYDEVYVSDATTLEEFGDFVMISKRIETCYGVVVSEILPNAGLECPLWQVLETIRKQSR